jgi:hypothetical protein
MPFSIRCRRMNFEGGNENLGRMLGYASLTQPTPARCKWYKACIECDPIQAGTGGEFNPKPPLLGIALPWN